jgi:hypothetical protein
VAHTHAEIDLPDAVCERVTVEEDSELRRLNYMAKMGQLSEHSRERMLELRLRDRRQDVREPREFGGDDGPPAPERRPRRFRFRSR